MITFGVDTWFASCKDVSDAVGAVAVIWGTYPRTITSLALASDSIRGCNGLETLGDLERRGQKERDARPTTPSIRPAIYTYTGSSEKASARLDAQIAVRRH